jgi:hypothetical protein
MKKLLFAAILVAGTTLGFAKDNVQKEVETTITKEAKQVVTSPQINAIDEALKKAICMDLHAFFEEVELPNGETDLVYAGSMEVSYECDNA